MIRPIQTQQAPRFGAAKPATDEQISTQLSDADKQVLMQMRLFEMEIEKCKEANKDVAKQVNLYDNITKTLGTASLTTVLGLMGATAFGAFTGGAGLSLPLGFSTASQWVLGGLVPAGVMVGAGLKKLIAASGTINRYYE